MSKYCYVSTSIRIFSENSISTLLASNEGSTGCTRVKSNLKLLFLIQKKKKQTNKNNMTLYLEVARCLTANSI